AALFFPLTAVASLFGMNLQHGLNPASAAIFWLISGASIVLGLAIMGWLLGRPAEPKRQPPK
ncbi:MAG: hypothetical protein V4773_29520, partial [Verrucomicrobiota bacterium]